MNLRIKNAFVWASIAFVLSTAKAEPLVLYSERDFAIYDLAYKDGVVAGKVVAAKRLTKLVSGTLKQRRLFMAVALTESQGTRTHKDGKIPIRFEHKWFKKCLSRKGVSSSDIPRSLKTHVNRYKRVKGKWEHKGLNEYSWIKKAKKLGWGYCAHWATSYGEYQIMGFNYKQAGFKSPIEMSDKYHENPTKEFNYKHFITFLKNYRGGKAYKELISGKLLAFSKTYNGSKKYVRSLRKNLVIAKRMIKS